MTRSAGLIRSSSRNIFELCSWVFSLTHPSPISDDHRQQSSPDRSTPLYIFEFLWPAILRIGSPFTCLVMDTLAGLRRSRTSLQRLPNTLFRLSTVYAFVSYNSLSSVSPIDTRGLRFLGNWNGVSCYESCMTRRFLYPPVRD